MAELTRPAEVGAVPTSTSPAMRATGNMAACCQPRHDGFTGGVAMVSCIVSSFPNLEERREATARPGGVSGHAHPVLRSAHRPGKAPMAASTCDGYSPYPQKTWGLPNRGPLSVPIGVLRRSRGSRRRDCVAEALRVAARASTPPYGPGPLKSRAVRGGLRYRYVFLHRR